VFRDHPERDEWAIDVRSRSSLNSTPENPYSWFRIYVQVSARDPNTGEIRCLSGLYVYVDDEIRAKAEIEASARYFRNLLENAPIGVFEVTDNMHCTYFNQKYLDIFGVEVKDILGLGYVLYSIFILDNYDMFGKVDQRYSSG
jgi:PAS domain-containing protein